MSGPPDEAQRAREGLAEAVIAEARARGYKRMLLDTLPEMAAARGFARRSSSASAKTEPYRRNPVPRRGLSPAEGTS